MVTVPDKVPPELQALRALQQQIEAVFHGKAQVVKLALVCVLAEGHLLLEDVPGVGKTMLARALARALALPFKRVQFTSDLLPSDILGVSIFDEARQSFVLHHGPIFHNVLLTDEINRASPRTQSALLEAMQERSVSLDNETYPLPRPFFVVATQNPTEYHGTYPLPESQLDRFLFRLSIGYPPPEVERALLLARGRQDPLDGMQPVMDGRALGALQSLVDEVHTDASLVDYLMSVVLATRQNPKLASGASTRTSLSILRAARAHALMSGRTFCMPDDLRAVCLPALAHRVRLNHNHLGAQSSRQDAERVVRELIAAVPLPR
jgi:MoxR-like ATPase